MPCVGYVSTTGLSYPERIPQQLRTVTDEVKYGQMPLSENNSTSTEQPVTLDYPLH